MSRLSKSFIDKIELPKKKNEQTFYRDSALTGFGLRVGAGGTKTFFVERRIDGKVKRVTIGKYGILTPEQARKEAQILLSDIVTGKNPAHEKQKKDAQSITLDEAFNDYLLTRKDLREGTINNYKKCIDGCLADWKKKRLVDITKDMVQEKHCAIGKKAPARANNTMRVLRAIFNHAINKYEDAQGSPLFEFNPVARLGQNRAWYPSKRKQTLLKPHELKPWFDATQQLNIEVTRDYLHFLLFTGLRKSEAASLRWQDVDFKDSTFIITHTKNNEPHTLPLTSFTTSILKRRKSQATNQWVFPSPISDGHLKEPRSSLAKVAEVSGIPFSCHDLRRTFITIAESLDIPAYALKRLLNHRDPNDVTQGYIISNVDRLREPMEKISHFIQEKFQ
jgi:integrase